MIVQNLQQYLKQVNPITEGQTWMAQGGVDGETLDTKYLKDSDL